MMSQNKIKEITRDKIVYEGVRVLIYNPDKIKCFINLVGGRKKACELLNITGVSLALYIKNGYPLGVAAKIKILAEKYLAFYHLVFEGDDCEFSE